MVTFRGAYEMTTFFEGLPFQITEKWFLSLFRLRKISIVYFYKTLNTTKLAMK